MKYRSAIGLLLTATFSFLIAKSYFTTKPLSEIYEKSKFPCFVEINTELLGESYGNRPVYKVRRNYASCFAVKYETKKVILTNAHVVAAIDENQTLADINNYALPPDADPNDRWRKIHDTKQSFSIFFKDNPKKYYEVTPDNADANKDLAILKLKNEKAYKRISYGKFGNPEEIKTGIPIAVIGNPMEFQFFLSHGIISEIDYTDKNQTIFSDALVAPGSSGGPVLDGNGEIIGMAQSHLIAVPSISRFIHLNEIIDYLDKIK